MLSSLGLKVSGSGGGGSGGDDDLYPLLGLLLWILPTVFRYFQTMSSGV
jgi:hypothetical protein